jgi:molybdate transport system ATP-binding protein
VKLCLHRIRLPRAEFVIELNLTITSQVTGLCGPSGAGKTTLLDLLAGLCRPDSAFIQLDDRVLTDTSRRFRVPVRHRQIGYVPQDLALFPHLSVRQNLVYGYKARASTDPQGLFSYAHVTDVLGIASLDARDVATLSGGEKQRVALARALLSSPRLLLLDEPLASLDRALKLKILPYLVRIRDEFHLPMIYVTHDLEEIRPLCDGILTMERGIITVG